MSRISRPQGRRSYKSKGVEYSDEYQEDEQSYRLGCLIVSQQNKIQEDILKVTLRRKRE
jgi:hypothetical protein